MHCIDVHVLLYVDKVPGLWSTATPVTPSDVCMCMYILNTVCTVVYIKCIVLARCRLTYTSQYQPCSRVLCNGKQQYNRVTQIKEGQTQGTTVTTLCAGWMALVWCGRSNIMSHPCRSQIQWREYIERQADKREGLGFLKNMNVHKVVKSEKGEVG